MLPRITQIQFDYYASIGRFQSPGARITSKSVNEVLRDYQNLLENGIVDVFNGNKTKGEFSRMQRSLIKGDSTDVYLEGMREGGIKDAKSELSDDDEQTISDWTTNQLDFVKDFADAIGEDAKLEGDAKTEARGVLFDRAAIWVQSLKGLGSLGYASAQANMMVTFRLGATEKHCSTCSRLNGKRHRLSWFRDRGLIPQITKGNENFACGSWKCDCILEDDDGNQVIP